MTGRAARRAMIVLAAIAAAVGSACAPKAAPDATPGVVIKFPDFLFPAVPTGLGDAKVVAAHQRGWRLLQAGDLRSAERAFGESLDASARFHPAEAGVGYVKLAAADYNEAVRRFDRALALAPEYVPALVGRGEAQLGLSRLDDARQSFVMALALDSSLTQLQRRVEVLQLRLLQEHVASARSAAQSGNVVAARESYGRAMAAAPDSAFLHRELAVIEQKGGDLDAAFAHAARALELEPGDVRTMVMLADIHEAKGDLKAAATLLAKVEELEPSAATAARLAALRESTAVAALPAEYHAIPVSPSITRGELAALLGIRLQPLLQPSKPGTTVVMTDTRGHWAATWILGVTRAGLMEAFPNHTFQPAGQVRRGDLARMAARALNTIAAANPAIAASWQNSRETFTDLPPTHLNYPAASRAVSAGVMPKLENNAFQWTRIVSGAEAVKAVERLEALARARRR